MKLLQLLLAGLCFTCLSASLANYQPVKVAIDRSLPEHYKVLISEELKRTPNLQGSVGLH